MEATVESVAVLDLLDFLAFLLKDLLQTGYLLLLLGHPILQCLIVADIHLQLLVRRN